MPHTYSDAQINALEVHIVKMVRAAYRPTKDDTGCNFCGIYVLREIPIEEFATWMHKGGCYIDFPIPVTTRLIREAANDD